MFDGDHLRRLLPPGPRHDHRIDAKIAGIEKFRIGGFGNDLARPLVHPRFNLAGKALQFARRRFISSRFILHGAGGGMRLGQRLGGGEGLKVGGDGAPLVRTARRANHRRRGDTRPDNVPFHIGLRPWSSLFLKAQHPVEPRDKYNHRRYHGNSTIRNTLMPQFIVSLLLMLALVGCADAPQPLNPSFPITFSQARAALDQMAAQPQPLSRPLLIIGGFMDPNVSPPLYKLEFQRLTGDDRIVTASVGFCGSFDECCKSAIDAVQQAYPSTDPNWTTEVDVVGASLGGLVARVAAAPSTDPSRPIAPEIAAPLQHLQPPKRSNPGRARIHPISQRYPRRLTLHADARTIRFRSKYKLFPYVCLGDELVGQTNAAPPGRLPLWLANAPLVPSHLEAMIDPRIRDDIARRLRGEEPFSKLPGTPLPQ